MIRPVQVANHSRSHTQEQRWVFEKCLANFPPSPTMFFEELHSHGGHIGRLVIFAANVCAEEF